MADQHEKIKRGPKRATFKTFGSFFTMHMVKKLITKRGKTSTVLESDVKQKHSDKDAIEAGFSSNGSNSQKYLHRNGSVNSSSYLGVGVSKAFHGIDLNSVKAIPGVFGLVNHGNTCYINSIVQCLSNTDCFAEYFVMGQYKADMKNCHKERSKKYGTKGEIAENLAVVVRSLWTGTYSQDMTKQFKETIGKFATQYKGHTQHDSQEFLLWLFDKLHEDLNQLPVKKFSFSKKQSFYRSSSYKGNKNNFPVTPNSSFILRVFQGQCQSSLTCRNCKKLSNTKDPFLCLSLPIRQRTTNPVYVNVAFLSNRRKSGIATSLKCIGKVWRIAVSVPMEGKLYDLRQAVASECGIHSRLLVFVDVQEDGFHSSYGDDCSLTEVPALSSNDPNNSILYAFEMPHIAKLTAGTLPRNFASKYNKHFKVDKHSMKASYSNHDSIVVLLINKLGIKDQGRRFGTPHVFRINRDVTLNELQSVVLSLLGNSLKNGIRHDKLTSSFSIEVVDGLPNKSCISHYQYPLKLPTVDKAVENCPAGGPLHIKLVVEWEQDTKLSMFEKISDEKVDIQESVRLQRLLHQQPVTCTLEECFDLYTQVEKLGPDDTWVCPHCRKQQHGTEKKLSLCSLPDILVLHLKRFHVLEGKRTKLCTRVEFPVTGLDISKHVYHDSKVLPIKSHVWKAGEMNNHFHGEHEYLYDLYAVCNHFGSLNSGHYTACCSNPLNGKWYQFDDNNTEVIQEEELSSQSAYILFYQRRSVSVALSCGGMSNNSIMSDHWAFNLPQYKQNVHFNSQGQLNAYSVSHKSGNAFNSIVSNCSKIEAVVSEIQSDVKHASNDESDEGGFDAPKKPFVRGLQRQNSAILTKSQQRNDELRGHQYRSFRNNRKLKHNTSPV